MRVARPVSRESATFGSSANRTWRAWGIGCQSTPARPGTQSWLLRLSGVPVEPGVGVRHDAEMARRSTAEAAEDSLWDDLAPDDPDETSPSTNMSENILGDAKEAVNTMDVDALSEAAEVFDKLAAHGKGFTVLDMQGFQELMLKLSQDEKGKKLLKLLMGNVETKVRRNSRER